MFTYIAHIKFDVSPLNADLPMRFNAIERCIQRIRRDVDQITTEKERLILIGWQEYGLTPLSITSDEKKYCLAELQRIVAPL